MQEVVGSIPSGSTNLFNNLQEIWFLSNLALQPISNQIDRLGGDDNGTITKRIVGLSMARE